MQVIQLNPASPRRKDEMRGKLKNYTTTIPAEKSIAEIEKLLLDFGAESFMKKADKELRQFTAILFTIEVRGKKVPFKLPANVNNVREYIYRQYCGKTARPKKEREDFNDEAYRVTWRLIKDWVHAQLSIIASDMVKVEEVFLPYLMIDKDRTFSQKFVSGEMDNLLPEYHED